MLLPLFSSNKLPLSFFPTISSTKLGVTLVQKNIVYLQTYSYSVYHAPGPFDTPESGEVQQQKQENEREKNAQQRRKIESVYVPFADSTESSSGFPEEGNSSEYLPSSYSAPADYLSYPDDEEKTFHQEDNTADDHNSNENTNGHYNGLPFSTSFFPFTILMQHRRAKNKCR
jgi:hypothetical protein